MNIRSIRVWGPSGEFGEVEEYSIGQEVGPAGKVTGFEQRDVSSEPYCCVSYIEVWCGNDLHAEFPKHNLAAIYYASPECNDD